MALLVGSTFLLFGALFSAIGHQSRSVAYLRYFGWGFLCAAVGFALHRLLPVDITLRSSLATPAYAVAAVLFAEGALYRVGLTLGRKLQAAVIVGLLVATAYFLFVDPDQLARIFTLSFVFGATLLLAAWKLSRHQHNRWADKLMIVTMALVGLHFVPRIILTAANFSSGSVDSLFWHILEVSLALQAVGGATAVLIVTGLDIAEALRIERDTDYLTGLLNRRGLEEQVRSAKGLKGHVLLVDIDHFKRVNDTWGHARGDDVLRALAVVLRATTRGDTTIARLGGEEFVLVIPGGLSGAEACAERLRQAVLAADLLGEGGDERITVSIGMAPLLQELSPALRGADLALYAAKRAGRNTVRRAQGKDDLPLTA